MLQSTRPFTGRTSLGTREWGQLLLPGSSWMQREPCLKFEILRLFFSTVWISLYYLAFYVVMSGLFALSIYCLMRTINPYEPDYQDQLKSPGTARVL